MFICPDKFQQQSVQLHLEHLKQIIDVKSEGCISILADKGIDNNFEHEVIKK